MGALWEDAGHLEGHPVAHLEGYLAGCLAAHPVGLLAAHPVGLLVGYLVGYLESSVSEAPALLVKVAWVELSAAQGLRASGG